MFSFIRSFVRSSRQVKLVQEDRDLIGSSEDYLAIHDYTAQLQKADATDLTTIGALKKVSFKFKSLHSNKKILTKI